MTKQVTTTSRRAILAGAAALSALAVPHATAHGANPIFAAIEDHRRKRQIFDDTVKREELLSSIIPEEKRQAYHVGDRDTDIGVDDDPRWKAFQQEYWAAAEAEEAAAINLLNVAPQTIQGVSALLLYAHEFEMKGNQWPDDIYGEGELDGELPRPWHTFLFGLAADAIDAIAGKAVLS